MDGATATGILATLGGQFAAFQALLLAASAFHKASTWGRSREVVRDFGKVPQAFAPAALSAIIAIETLAALMSVIPVSRIAGSVLAAFVWSSYLALIARAIVQRRNDIDCGCTFGAAAARPLGAYHATRNAVLVVVAFAVACVSVADGSFAVLPSQAVGSVALLALYGALDQVMALPPLRRGEAL